MPRLLLLRFLGVTRRFAPVVMLLLLLLLLAVLLFLPASSAALLVLTHVAAGPGGARFLRGKFVCIAARVGRASALAGDCALALRIHRGEASA